MSARGAYICQIQGCNVLLILLGMGAVGLAGSQFSRVGIDTIRDIDLRLLNWIHILTGSIGMFSVFRNHGSIVTKTLYCVSIVIGISSAIFYGFTTYRVVEASRQLQSLQQTNGFEQEFGQENTNFAGRIAISATMIGIAALAALVAMIAVLVLDRLVVANFPVYPVAVREHERALVSARKSVASLAVLKICFALGVLGLSAFIEYEHELVAAPDNRYIKIALEHIAAMLAVCSAAVDLVAVRSKRQESLNLKVAVAMSVIAAVWCVKSVDNIAVPFYKNDLKAYYIAQTTGDVASITNTSPRYIVVVCVGVLLGSFCLLFLLCVFSACAAGAVLCTDQLSLHQQADKGLRLQDRMLSVLHVIWAGCLLGLSIIGLLDLIWRGEFLGGDLIWTSALFLSAGIVVSSNNTTHVTARFVLNVVCAGVAVEKMCASIHLIYEYASYDIYRNGNQRTYVGQIVLICVTTGVFAAETATAIAGSVIFGRALARQQTPAYRYSSGVHVLFSIGTLFYAVVITGCYVVFELGKWRFNEVPIDVPFFRLGNGPFVGAVFLVQLATVCELRLLAGSVVLHAIAAALALFTISSAITNVYYLANIYSVREFLRATPSQDTIVIVAIILAAGAALACVVETFCSTICALRSSYLLHHKSASTSSTVVAPLEEHFGSLQHEARISQMSVHPQMIPSQYSAHSPVHLQPMEEQSVYWSADENPFYYHTSKRFYGQPYQIESGFYGYPAPATSQQHRRRLQSSAAQTQIGHVFD